MSGIDFNLNVLLSSDLDPPYGRSVQATTCPSQYLYSQRFQSTTSAHTWIVTCFIARERVAGQLLMQVLYRYGPVCGARAAKAWRQEVALVHDTC